MAYKDRLSKAEKEGITHRMLVDSFGKRIDTEIRNLDQLADIINETFPNVDVKSRPEYRELLVYIGKYKKAIVDVLNADYEKRCRPQAIFKS